MAEESTAYATSTIAEMTGGIILAHFEKDMSCRETSYQSEADLEKKLLAQLSSEGYEQLHLHTSETLYQNLQAQIERLNQVTFSPLEWERFLLEYLDAPGDTLIEKTRKVQEDYLYDFTFDDGHVQNIRILDKENIHNNFLQVTSQVRSPTQKNRYDVTILVNGLPLVHLELKKRGVSLSEAFEQIHRYTKESFNKTHSLYKYVQIFVISNGTYTRYFANTTKRDKNHYRFTAEWADAKNRVIPDLEDFARTFLEKRVLLSVLTKYCVFDVTNTLLVLRPYQIAATERIIWKIKTSFAQKKYGTIEAGGFIWHATGSGKTLTSFKVARLATRLDFIEKVFFVVDRKDLDAQTIKEYNNFQKDSVTNIGSTRALQEAIDKDDMRIVVTTIQKLNAFIKSHPTHPIYHKHCVIIFDECHRSQFGEAQKNIRRAFKKYYQFGFTGTPIFPENSLGSDTTAGTFGAQLHSYVITDAIRDKKVLKFKVDYHNITPRFKSAEQEVDAKKLIKLEKKMLLHPERIKEITSYILKVFDQKTRRNEHYDLKNKRLNGFNAMFAVQSIDAARLYYEEFQSQQALLPEAQRLKLATIFSYVPNEEQSAQGEIAEEDFSASYIRKTDKEFLEKALLDYNAYFKTNFSTKDVELANYYEDLSKKVKEREIDLVIVVGMFLTGFDAPTLNTLFVDKNLCYHGLLQAFSRTNRILNKIKAFGNIVCFRDLEQATKDAIKLFGDKNSINVILEKSYKDYIEGFFDTETGEKVKGYEEICHEMLEKFPEPTEITLEKDKKEFALLFGELLKRENILKNFDEFTSFTPLISERQMQDMKSTYVDIRESVLQKRGEKEARKEAIDFSNVEFQIELLKTDEINLDYILTLILETTRENHDEESLKGDIRRVIRSSLGTRAKETLIMDFIEKSELKKLQSTDDILEAFYTFAKEAKAKEIATLISEEKLKDDAGRFINKSIKKGTVDCGGTELDNILPPVSRRQGLRQEKKETVLAKISRLVEVFVGI